MSKITVLNEKAIAVEVPAYPEHFKPYVGNIRNSLMYWENTDLKETELLPPGEWSILGRPDQITEGQWMEILPPNMGSFETASMRGRSLLKSKSLEGKSIIILIKQ